MKTAYKNIYQILKLNRIIVFSVLILGLGTSLFSGILTYTIHQESLNGAFVLNEDGAIIPLKWVAARENLEVEVLAHLELFHTNFYNIDASNFEKQLEKALWLGDSSVSEAYLQKKSDGVYNRLIQYSLVQRVLEINTKLDISKEPYQFKTTTQFEINRGSVVDSYELVTTGKLIHVDRHFPNNTHGLLITDYFESTLKKLDNKNY